jgi:ATP-dependent DNA ligase
MKAHPLDPKKLSKLGDSFFIQPKLDGVRAYVEFPRSCEPAILLSSTSRVFPYLDSIKESLNKLAKVRFDGELYIHGKPWEYINSIASRTTNRHPDEEELEYHIFDIKSQYLTFVQRYQHLCKVEANIRRQGIKNIKVIRTDHSTPTLWITQLEDYASLGYEGVVFRSTTGLYEEKRSNNLLKFKPSHSDIYKIVGAIQGTGWCYNRLGAFEVQDKNGLVFEIGTGSFLTAKGRSQAWNMHMENKLVGCHLLVKHEKLTTANGFPKCAVAVELILPEDLYKYAGHNDLVK